MSDAAVTKEVLTPVTPVTAPLISLRAYARHRDVSATSVHRAIESGRLVKCVVRDAAGKFRGIDDVALADREWTESTDLAKAPTAVIERAEEQQHTPVDGSGEESATALDNSASAGTVDPERLSPLMRQKYWQAKTAELDYKRQVGELVDAKDIEAKIADEYSKVRTKMLGVARKAKAQLPHLTREDVATIDGLIREALQDIATGSDEEPSS